MKDSPSDPSNKTLYYDLNGDGIGRVNHVSRLGTNDSFIIVESAGSRQSPRNMYWILDKDKDTKFMNSNEIIEGPFSLEEFNARKEELGIGNLNLNEQFE